MARSTATATLKAVAAAAPATGMAALCDELSASFAERDSVIRATARAFLAGEHVFILGEPGTGKSLLVRCFAQALGLSYWEYLMTRYSTPEELFGPLSIPELQKGRYTRNYAGYLPGAEVVFLDEVWKSNSGILNALLTATNERVFHDDGKPVSIPLVSLVGASNELPESESELGALYDRFLVRLVTKYVADRDAFKAMIFTPTPVAPTVKVDLRAEQALVRAVTIPVDVQDAIVSLRYACRDGGYTVSDRRWRQCVKLVQAAAHLEGRTVASLEDLECLEDVLWRTPEERSKVIELIQQVSNPDGAEAVKLLDAARELRKGLPPVEVGSSTWLAKAGGVNKDLKDIAKRLESLSGRKVDEVASEVASISSEVRKLTLKASGIDA